MSNSCFRAYDIEDMKVYSLEEPEVFELAVAGWGIHIAGRWKLMGAYYSVNFDYFVPIDEPDLGKHTLAPWWRKP